MTLTWDAGSDATIDEGDEFSQSGSFADPGADTWTGTADYGDGGGAEALPISGKLFGLAHTYADDVVATVAVTVTDDDGGEGEDAVQVTVNVPKAARVSGIRASSTTRGRGSSSGGTGVPTRTAPPTTRRPPSRRATRSASPATTR